MSKQSSIKWLEMEIQKSIIPAQKDYFKWAFEQAKAMHRIEILEARQNGLDNGFSNGSWDSQLYYTEEFGGNNEQQ